MDVPAWVWIALTVVGVAFVVVYVAVNWRRRG